jgi:Putative peptidoglycan binding domain
VRARLSALGHSGTPDEAGLDAALAAWAGIENLEERVVAGRIDPLVLAHLRDRPAGSG